MVRFSNFYLLIANDFLVHYSNYSIEEIKELKRPNLVSEEDKPIYQKIYTDLMEKAKKNNDGILR